MLYCHERLKASNVNGKRGKVLKWYERLIVGNVNGERGHFLKRHERLKAGNVNGKQGFEINCVTWEKCTKIDPFNVDGAPIIVSSSH